MTRELMTIEDIRSGLRIIRERRNNRTDIYGHGALELAEELLKHYDALEAKLNQHLNEDFVTNTDLSIKNARLREALQPFAGQVTEHVTNENTLIGIAFPPRVWRAATEAMKGDTK